MNPITTSIACLGLALACSAQSIGKPRGMKKTEILYYTGTAGIWHDAIGGDLDLCDIPLRVEMDGQ
ncbi:MAG: hypothetical protein QF412_11200, partial [Planctomycetota bacterium]|nr:hypothetical protein [Planctomycetota bacterium]